MMEFFDFTVKKVNPDDTFQYHCFRCGECCHNVKDAIMLSSFDLFQLAKFLNRNMEQVIEDYTTPVTMSEFGFPLLMLKTKQHGDACVFYKTAAPCKTQNRLSAACTLSILSQTSR